MRVGWWIGRGCSARHESLEDIELAVRDPTPVPTWTPVEPESAAPPSTIWQPRLSPDGSRVVFRALGRLWQQPLDSARGEPLDGGEAQRLVDSDGIEFDPTFSPDG